MYHFGVFTCVIMLCVAGHYGDWWLDAAAAAGEYDGDDGDLPVW